MSPYKKFMLNLLGFKSIKFKKTDGIEIDLILSKKDNFSTPMQDHPSTIFYRDCVEGLAQMELGLLHIKEVAKYTLGTPFMYTLEKEIKKETEKMLIT